MAKKEDRRQMAVFGGSPAVSPVFRVDTFNSENFQQQKIERYYQNFASDME